MLAQRPVACTHDCPCPLVEAPAPTPTRIHPVYGTRPPVHGPGPHPMQSFNKVYADQTGAVFIQLPQNAGGPLSSYCVPAKAERCTDGAADRRADATEDVIDGSAPAPA